MPDYTIADAQRILDAYRALLPDYSRIISDYLDICRQRRREWACLTTNFHDVTLDVIKEFDRVVRGTDINAVPRDELGQYFRQLSIEHNVGYSMGISPWTDYLLNTSYKPDLKKVVIILGHDWYPIVPRNLKIWDSVYPPLRKCTITGDYDLAIPASIKNGKFILFFMNIYPDFRAPFTEKTGSLGNANFYQPFVEGFEAICTSIATNYEIVALVVWGGDAWNALRLKIDVEWQKRGFIETIAFQHMHFGSAIPITLGGRIYKTFPLPHPSYLKTNYPKAFREIYGKSIDEIIRGIDEFIGKNIAFPLITDPILKCS